MVPRCRIGCSDAGGSGINDEGLGPPGRLGGQLAEEVVVVAREAAEMMQAAAGGCPAYGVPAALEQPAGVVEPQQLVADEGGNHFMFIENPDRFNRLVADFLSNDSP